MEVVVTAGVVRCANFQSNRCHQQTNTQFFTGLMPFRHLTNSVNGKSTTFHGLSYPRLTWESSILVVDYSRLLLTLEEGCPVSSALWRRYPYFSIDGSPLLNLRNEHFLLLTIYDRFVLSSTDLSNLERLDAKGQSFFSGGSSVRNYARTVRPRATPFAVVTFIGVGHTMGIRHSPIVKGTLTDAHTGLPRVTKVSMVTHREKGRAFRGSPRPLSSVP